MQGRRSTWFAAGIVAVAAGTTWALAGPPPDGVPQGSSGGTSPVPPSTLVPDGTTTPAPPAPAPETEAPRTLRAGDLVISGISGTSASSALRRRARDGRIAGVILMGTNITTVQQVRRLTASLQRAAAAGGHPPLLVLTDQEGGTVKRFRSAHPSVSARALGHAPLRTVQAQGRRTAADLLARGVNVNLAPVVDVPDGPSSFLGTRAFANDADAVARNACRFAEGLREGGLIATLKHFPGLGTAGVINTDDAPVTITSSATRLAADWTPYRDCGGAPRTLTMVSNARYKAIGGGRPAVLSSDTYATARRIGISGPFITDALEAAAVRGTPNLAARAVNAGADLVLYTSEDGAITGEQQIRSATPQRVLRQRAATVRALREALR